jgi:glycosyltransferase involved in cell wall biosynthesis
MNNLACRVDQLKISIVTACLNAEQTIERTLQSIEQQGCPNLELIVVDGLSTDRTMEIVRQYGHVVSQTICEKDRGIAEAINKGFRLATGDIFCYLNADDCFAPGALHRIAEEFLAHPETDIITGGCQRVFADGSILVTQVPEHFERLMALRNGIEQPSTFWRASIHRKAGKLDESYSLAFDWEWWNRLHSTSAKFRVIKDVLSVYYFTDDNLTSKAGMRVINEMYRVTKTYGPYRGYLADVYRVLFRLFDMKGYYDQPFVQLGLARKYFFGGTLSVLYAIFGREAINAYNWNWASKQIRGITWYK